MAADTGYNATQYLSLFGLYLPVTYILAGFLADVVSQKWGMSAVSLAAICGMLVNYVISQIVDRYIGLKTIEQQRGILNGMATTLNMVSSGCTVPGLEGLESIIAPQSLVIIFAMIVYLWINISTSKSGQSIGSFLGFGAGVTVLQLLILYTNACWTGDFYVSNYPLQRFMTFPIIVSLLCGVAGAGIAYGINIPISNALNAGSNNKVGHIFHGQSNIASTSQPSSDSALPHVGGPVGGQAVSSDTDDNQFVCEAYKNGELISSTITE